MAAQIVYDLWLGGPTGILIVKATYSHVHKELLVKCIVIYPFILLEHEDKHKTHFDTCVLIKSKSSEDPDKKKKNDHEIPQ